MRKPEKEQATHSQVAVTNQRDREISERLKALIAQKRKDDLEGNSPRARGRAARVLRPRLDDLREMISLGMNIREMEGMLAEAGLMVSYQNLRSFLLKHMPVEYREHLAMGAGKGIPEAARLPAGMVDQTANTHDCEAPLTERVEQYLGAVREAMGEELFESGQCHTLAITLRELFGGDLYAILRHEVDEEGERFSTTYSHMTCEIGSQCYDIGGTEADTRWCARWPDEPDEDGLTSEFEFVAIAPDELEAFLEKYRAVPVVQNLVAQLQIIARREAADPELVEQVGPRLSCPAAVDSWEDGEPGTI